MSIKTRKSVAKRFKVTATGKVKRRHAGMRHLLSVKSAKRRRRLGQGAILNATDTRMVLANLPHNH